MAQAVNTSHVAMIYTKDGANLRHVLWTSRPVRCYSSPGVRWLRGRRRSHVGRAQCGVLQRTGGGESFPAGRGAERGKRGALGEGEQNFRRSVHRQRSLLVHVAACEMCMCVTWCRRRHQPTGVHWSFCSPDPSRLVVALSVCVHCFMCSEVGEGVGSTVEGRRRLAIVAVGEEAAVEGGGRAPHLSAAVQHQGQHVTVG